MSPQRHEHPVLRVATYNIHKGVQGLGPARRLEIHNLGHAVEQLDADIVCLQEVRRMHRREERHFAHWPSQTQAEYLAPEGYESVYRTNAITRHGEHGNALLSRWPVLTQQHQDISDHRFEQRGLLHTSVQVVDRVVHVVVVHLGLVPASRVRQVVQLLSYIEQHVPAQAPVLVAGDFNDWGTGLGRRMALAGFGEWREQPTPTFPSRLPLNQLDHIYARGLRPLRAMAPTGRIWQRMSDHLPLVAEFAWTD
jgi:endonuclease/exonuclease/phosphatase family metal-dependent hydrolase